MKRRHRRCVVKALGLMLVPVILLGSIATYEVVMDNLYPVHYIEGPILKGEKW